MKTVVWKPCFARCSIPRAALGLTTQQSRPGFTLIEVLVSVTIIAILVGLAFVAIGSSLKSARQAKCNSNLRQLVMATAQYSDANKRLLPLARDRIDVRLGDIAPLPALEPHLGVPPPRLEGSQLLTSELFRCPEDKVIFKITGCSYDYMPTAMMMVSIAGNDTQREVSSMYWREEVPSYLWKDRDPFHGSAVPGGIFAAWPDGSVRPRPPLGAWP